MLYRERRNQPLWQLMLALLLTISLGIAYAAATSSTLGSIIGVGLSVPAVWLWRRAAADIELTDSFLCVGRLRLELSAIGTVTVLTPVDFLKRIRTGAKTTDLLLFNRTDGGGVALEIADETDPYRAWVISSRSPEKFAAALTAAVADAPQQAR